MGQVISTRPTTIHRILGITVNPWVRRKETPWGGKYCVLEMYGTSVLSLPLTVRTSYKISERTFTVHNKGGCKEKKSLVGVPG